MTIGPRWHANHVNVYTSLCTSFAGLSPIHSSGRIAAKDLSNIRSASSGLIA
ncbi:hypothetical protein CHELA40_13180 [Chelatococcus asaccharovorans]|nr:hypothetical protein CHELA40_13180 [Chelatococcus asaccharovorans]CAH1679829.1 hypothetical protein CHELA17_62440 [Chelatococcus asaccharovorans]